LEQLLVHVLTQVAAPFATWQVLPAPQAFVV
jgi:hypothetical protein